MPENDLEKNAPASKAWGCYLFIAAALFLLMLLFLSWGDESSAPRIPIPPLKSTVQNNFYVVDSLVKTAPQGPLVRVSDTGISQTLVRDADSVLRLKTPFVYLQNNPQDPILTPEKTGIINLEPYQRADSHLLLKGEWSGKSYNPNLPMQNSL